MKSSRLLEEVKARIDIVDFIADYVALKKAGQNYRGLCPFHTEKTPSFMVSRSKQIFHCFGCGAGGDVVTFVMKHDNVTFGEALRYIATKTGIEITEPAYDRSTSVMRSNILLANNEALKYFRDTLSASGNATSYLRQRGISEDTTAAFCLGYASQQRNALYRYLRSKGYSDAVLMNAGLVASDGTGYKDWFRGRIIFPIHSLRGDVVAFGGRVMDNSLPKYINTRETELFKKSENLFALNRAKDAIRQSEYAIIVEGYFDAIICHQAGFCNTVAPLGTALTQRHLQKLKSITDTIVLVFDGDDAGIAAARRSLSACCEQDIVPSILILPRGDDPDSFLRKSGSEAFRNILSTAQSMIDFLLRSARGQRIAAVREALAMIASMKDMILADEVIRELADKSKINEIVIRRELDKARRNEPTLGRERAPAMKSPPHPEELILLSALLSFPEKANTVLSQICLDDIADQTIRGLFSKISAIGDALHIGVLLSTANDDERRLLTSLSLNPGFDAEYVETNIADCVQKLKQRKADRELRRAVDAGDINRLNALLQEKRTYKRGARP